MLIKFETKSARVKGVAFHQKRSWILASLHNGVIQLWDYSEKSLIDKFVEYECPVRGLDFHPHQPLFVAGGDNAKIKVFNYKEKRCLFTLNGAHEDYIRTTCFHHEHPWILSASDDNSIRIWNWQSRSRIAVLTGHQHYVMCAQFHPSQDLILSASIEQNLRLWDVTGLKMKSSKSSKDGLPEILSTTDYSVVSVEAHNSEINWCCFHPDPNKQLCLSAADDNNVKIWKITSCKSLREVDTLRGHTNNVNCAVFHPKKDLALSVSEDRSIRVWDLERRTALCTHRKDVDRFWTIAAHPKEDLFVAGHDTGLMLFKLERERPAYCIENDTIIFIRSKAIHSYNLKNGQERVLTTLKPKTELTHYYYRLHVYSNQVLVSVRSTNVDRSVCDLYTLRDDSVDPFRTPGLTGIFIGPNRYAILDKHKRIIFMVKQQERKPKTAIHADEIFPAGAGRLFIKSKVDDTDSISLWDVESESILNSVKVDAKSVIMSDNKKYVACICSNKIVICDGQLNILGTVNEQRKIKSAAWEAGGVLVYTTPVQVKYSLTDGDTTTILSVQQTLYIMTIRDNQIVCIDRNGAIKKIPVDLREFKFKQAVIRNERSAILASLRELGSLTRAEVSFLVKKGHPGLALKFVDDAKTRFQLALQAFKIDEALKAALEIDEKECWKQLVPVAWMVGHVMAAEAAYKHLKEPYKLAMLYLVCDNRDKMLEARKMAMEMGDTSTEFMISLLVKDFKEMCNILLRSGRTNLAYICAVNHALYDVAKEIYEKLNPEQLKNLPPPEDALKKDDWMLKTIPNIGNKPLENWPLLNDEQDKFEDILAEEEEDGDNDLEGQGDWEDGLPSDESEMEGDKGKLDGPNGASFDEYQDNDGWSEDEPLQDLPDDDDDETVEALDTFVAPSAGQNITSKWTQISDLALHHVLAGSYKSACGLLQNQVGIIAFEPLKGIFKDLIMRSRLAYQSLALYPTMYTYPVSSELKGDVYLPAGGYDIESLEERLTECYGLFSRGKFADAIDQFRNLLLSTLFLQIYSESDKSVEEIEKRVREIITICREYILALQIWSERKSITGKEFEDHKRACELASYFARLNLPKHRSKILEKAFEVFVIRPEDFHKTRAASSIATRLLDYINTSDPKKEKMVKYAKKIKTSYDATVDQRVKLDYDDLNPYSLCASTFRPIYSGNSLSACPFCDAKYKTDFSGEVCRVCLVAEIGRSCGGLRFKPVSFDED